GLIIGRNILRESVCTRPEYPAHRSESHASAYTRPLHRRTRSRISVPLSYGFWGAYSAGVGEAALRNGAVGANTRRRRGGGVRQNRQNPRTALSGRAVDRSSCTAWQPQSICVPRTASTRA